jgi:hypothetical protein
MWKREIENVNSGCTELTMVAELTRDDSDPRLKMTAPRRSRAVASTLRGANGSRDDGGAIGKMERAAVE